MRLSRLRPGEIIVAAAVVVMAVSLFALDWYGEPSRTGWNGTTHVRYLLLLDMLLGLALVVTQAACRAPAIPVSVSVFSTVVALVTALWLIYRVLIDSQPHQELGAWLELIGGLALLVGSFLSMREEGIAAQDGPGEIPVVNLPAPSG